jgi:hypothetical protein
MLSRLPNNIASGRFPRYALSTWDKVETFKGRAAELGYTAEYGTFINRSGWWLQIGQPIQQI